MRPRRAERKTVSFNAVSHLSPPKHASLRAFIHSFFHLFVYSFIHSFNKQSLNTPCLPSLCKELVESQGRWSSDGW